VGDAIGVVERQAEGDLKRFEEYIETRREPSGSWRGQVHGGNVHEERVREPARPR
jgi:hypothetical protein